MAEEVTTLNNLLVNEIGSQIDFLTGVDPGTDTHEKCVKDISTLYKVFNDENDLANKYEELQNKKESDEARLKFEKEKLEFEKEKLGFEKEQAKKTEEKEKKQKIADIIMFGIEQGVKIASLAISVIAFKNRFREGLQFETTGSVSSKFFGGLTSKMKMTKVD